jgi:YD repeat-containing protein
VSGSKNGKLVTQNDETSGERTEYRYNAAGQQNRITTQYRYDAYGRRTITQEAGGDAMRTVYDGFSFDVIREGVTFVDGSVTTRYATGIAIPQTQTEGLRYRYLGDDTASGNRTRNLNESTSHARYTGIGVTLYGRGEAVAVSRSASNGSKGGAVYLGKDLLGSVRSKSRDT